MMRVLCSFLLREGRKNIRRKITDLKIKNYMREDKGRNYCALCLWENKK